ncbi:hypothetical protein SAY86_001030 [Trapa natans]|uniref:Protein PHLOEM PROTEIN 2-LIKE A1-like n=1 Tax=Trapa natans TaxID=22666 RepID=A0AAN7MD17_TRANT|nr:hypothetical protein SAY86_001030 [Trapa natans]
MGNTQSEFKIPFQAHKKTEVESHHLQPQATMQTAEVQPQKEPGRLPTLGVFSNQKLWIDKKTGKKCLMVFARDLSITWADTPDYWRWNKVQEPRDEVTEEAELLAVCWLEAQGQYEISMLSPDTVYEILFVIMIKDPSYGWEVPVNFRLILPDGTKQVRRENLMEKPKGIWIEVPAGELRTSMRGNSGKMEFSMFEYEGGNWKGGLVIKGVQIRPKK